MKLTELSIQRFGLLGDRHVGQFGDGLNVIHGPNGAGKSTLFQFVRGTLHGFGDAQQAGLLGRVPTDTSPGTIGIEIGTRTGECQRVVDGNSGRFKSSLGSPAVLETSRAIGFQDPYEPNATESLVHAAPLLGIDLHASSRPIGELDSIRDLLENDRKQCTTSMRTTLDICRRLAARMQTAESSRRQLLAEHESHRAKRSELSRRIAEMRDERERLRAELDGLARRVELEAQERCRRTSERAARIDERLKSLAALDARIERLRAVLEDLDSRAVELHRDVERAAAVGFDESFDAPTAVRDIEADVESLARSGENCRHCGSGSTSCCHSTAAAAEVLRERVHRLCETIGRREIAWRAVLARRELDELDAGRRGLRHRLESLAKQRHTEAAKLDSAGVFELLGRSASVEDVCRCERHATHLESLRRHLHGLKGQPAAEVEGFETRSGLDDQSERTKSRIRELDDCIASDERELSSLAHDSEPRVDGEDDVRLRTELGLHQRKFARLASRDRELGRQLAIVSELRGRPARTVAPQIVAEVSSYLKRVTRGAYFELRVVDGQVELHGDGRGWIDQRRTSAGTQHLVGLLLRLAINAELHRRGDGVPLLLDDVLVHNDVDRQRIALEMLAEYAAAGQQIIMFTCHPHLRDDGGDHGGRLFEFAKQGSEENTTWSERRAAVRPERRPMPPTPVAETPRRIESQPAEAVESDGADESDTLPFDVVPTFALNTDDEVRRVPQMTKRHARILALAGVHTVDDLLELDVEGRLPLLEHHRLERATVVRWQNLARLLVTIPSLKAVDAAALAEMRINDVEELTSLDEREFATRLMRLQQTAVGRGLLQSGRRIDVDWFQDLQGYTRFARTVEQSRRATSSRTGSRSKRRRTGNASHRTRRDRESAPTQGEDGLRFFLSRTSPLEDAPSIGPKTAGRFLRIGVRTVDEFLVVDADDAARRIDKRHISADTIRAWKLQAEFVCRVPELRGHDAQILVACGVETPEALAAAEPRKLLAVVTPFCKSSAGQRIIRSGKAPDLAEVTAWIAWANRSRTLRAA